MNDKDLVDELLDKPPAPAPLPVLRFRPWHRPRKQLVRSEQWATMLRGLLLRLRGRGHSRVVKYLGLPGSDLLDVRVFHDVVAALGTEWTLQFLGFNGENGADRVLSEAATRDLPQLQWQRSIYLPHRLETVCDDAGPGGRALLGFGGIDVVNVDLCDAVSPPNGSGILESLRAIVAHQVRSRAEPWLLYLTARVDPTSLDPKAHAAILDCIVQNSARHSAFEREFGREFEIAAADLVAALGSLRDGLKFDPGHPPSVVSLGIAKWLLGLLHDQRWTIKAGNCFMYAIGSAQPNMVALAFEFEHMPLRISDPSGLTPAGAVATPAGWSEEKIACRLVTPMARMVDIDALLASDDGLRRLCVQESAELLERAGHRREAYVTWVENGEDD